MFTYILTFLENYNMPEQDILTLFSSINAQISLNFGQNAHFEYYTEPPNKVRIQCEYDLTLEFLQSVIPLEIKSVEKVLMQYAGL